jgi:predicted nucleic acid-binding protein
VVVVDSSVVLAWVLKDTDANHLYSDRVAQLGLDGVDTLAAPLVMTTECAAVLLKKARAGKWGAVLAAEYAETIQAIPMRYYASQAPIAAQVRFAFQHNVQGYDAVYVALAQLLSAKLATLDGGMKTAARAAGVELFV